MQSEFLLQQYLHLNSSRTEECPICQAVNFDITFISTYIERQIGCSPTTEDIIDEFSITYSGIEDHHLTQWVAPYERTNSIQTCGHCFQVGCIAMEIYRQHTLSGYGFHNISSRLLCPICRGPIATPIREYYRQRQNEENERRQQREAVPHTLQNNDAVLSLSVDSYEPNYDNSPETSPNTIANRGAVSHNDLEEE